MPNSDSAVLDLAEKENKNKNLSAREERHATSTPLVISVDGIFATA